MDIELLHILCAGIGIVLFAAAWIISMICFDKDKIKAANIFIFIVFVGLALFFYGNGVYYYSLYGPLQLK